MLQFDIGTIERCFGASIAVRPIIYNFPWALRMAVADRPGVGKAMPKKIVESGVALVKRILMEELRPRRTVALAVLRFGRSGAFARADELQDFAKFRPFPVHIDPIMDEFPGDAHSDCYFIVPHSNDDVLQRLAARAVRKDSGHGASFREINIFLVDIEQGILLNPYDHRGMDIAVRDREKGVYFFRKYRAHLFEHDIGIMNSRFCD